MWSANWNIFNWLENQLNKITDITFSTGDNMQTSTQIQCFLTSRPTGSVCTISSRPGVVTSSRFSWCVLGTVSGTRMTCTPWWRSPVCVQCIIVRIQVFWVVTLCCRVRVSRRSFRKSRNTSPLTQRHISEDLNPQKSHGNPKIHNMKSYLFEDSCLLGYKVVSVGKCDIQRTVHRDIFL